MFKRHPENLTPLFILFVAGPNAEMNWIKVDEEIFYHVGKRISQGYNQPHWRPRQRAIDTTA